MFQQADGRWVAQLSIGPRGNRRYVRRVRRTEKGAGDALNEIKLDHGMGREPSKLDVGTYLRRWLDDSARPAIGPSTYRGYSDAIALLEPIHHLALAKLRPEDIERACAQMLVKKGRRNVAAAPKTVRNAQVMLRKALAQAEARGHIARNVAKLVPLRRVPRRSLEALTPDVARRVLAALAGDRYEAAYALAMIGLRESEILGLIWPDLDRKAHVVQVRYQIVGSGEAAVRAQLKTAASEAPVPLPAFVWERLDAHRLRQLEERAGAGQETEEGLIFVTDQGWAVNGSWFGKHFQQLLDDAGLPKMTVHQLRHGAASLLVAAGAHPRVAQELLRHASSKTTMEIYSHVTAAQQREAADLLEKAVAG